jgi:lipopolysaccharide biosynthesis glycosyltransferase
MLKMKNKELNTKSKDLNDNNKAADLIKKANKAFKDRDYESAVELYKLLGEYGGIYNKIAEVNLNIIKIKSKCQPNMQSLGASNIVTSPGSVDFIMENKNIDAANILSESDQLKDVLSSEFWDKDWYEINYSQQITKYKINQIINITAEEYYIKEGWRKGHKPSELFEFSNNPFPKDPKINHISYFVRNTIYRGYHFRHKLPGTEQIVVDEYLKFKSIRGRGRGVIYKCITGGYGTISPPPYINKDWDYICFTDSVEKEIQIGVWLLKPLIYTDGDKASQNRWHKFFPHVALADYRESVYLDGNVDIRNDYFFKIIDERNQELLLPRHFARSCTYDEGNALLNSERFTSVEKEKFNNQIKFLENEKFPADWGLSENNLIYRKHDSSKINSAMDLWWWMYQNHSQRDQLGLAYSLWRYDINLKDFLIENCRIDYKHFWVSSHDGSVEFSKKIKNKITPVNDNSELILFSTNDSFYAYLGIAIESLIKNSNPNRYYDVVVLCTDLSATNASRILSLDKISLNVSVRLFDMKELLSNIDKNIFHLEGYVPIETYYKFFVADITLGYKKCLYLDSDIFINDDIGKLLDINLEGNLIGATPNIANIHAAKLNQVVKGKNFRDYLENSLGIKDYTKYFQAGVLSLDIDKLRAFDLANKAINALRSIQTPIFFDQCVFNKLFHSKCKFIDLTWNHVWYLQDYSYLRTTIPTYMYYNYAKSRINPSIIHFAGKDKYYSKPEWKLADIFWSFVNNSIFKDYVLEDCKTRVTVESTQEAIFNTISNKVKKKPKLLIHLHLFYPEQTEFMLSKLVNISGVDYDIYVTQVQRNKESEKNILNKYPNAKIYTMNNAGYDIHPFLVVLKNVKLVDYDFILKIHTKNKRLPGNDLVYGVSVPQHTWRDELINSLIGTKEIFEKNIKVLSEEGNVGLISCPKFYFNSDLNNEEKNYNLPYWRGRLKIAKSTKYVGGSMFLARAYPFEKIKHHGLVESDFTNVNGYATKDWKNLAHVFERLLGFCIESEGYRFYE